MDIQLVYKVGDKEFKVGDLVTITEKNVFNGELTAYIGKLLPPTLGNKIEIDCSRMFEANRVSIFMSEIVSME